MPKEFESFYYSADRFLIWVAGYTADGNTDSVVKIIESLKENAQKFADKVGCKLEEVQTLYNSKPPRYQYMRIFYIETETPHPEAFASSRNMWDILTS